VCVCVCVCVCLCVWCRATQIADYSLMVCYAVSVGKYLSTFRKSEVPSSSWSSSPLLAHSSELTLITPSVVIVSLYNHYGKQGFGIPAS
jgi:hypothetical protein